MEMYKCKLQKYMTACADLLFFDRATPNQAIREHKGSYVWPTRKTHMACARTQQAHPVYAFMGEDGLHDEAVAIKTGTYIVDCRW